MDTRTRGVDVVSAYFTPLGRGKLDITLSANFTNTDVQNVNVPQSSIDAFKAANGREPTADELQQIANTFFNREEFNRLETALPRQKGTLGVKYAQGRISLGARATYYGEIKYRPVNPDNDENFSAKTLFDLDVTYDMKNGAAITIGANNIFNTFPDEHRKPANRSGERFIYSRRVTQFGTNGGFYYARLSLNL